MKLLPYHSFEITSRLKQADALAAIGAQLEPRRWFRVRWPNSANDKRFAGAVSSDGFEVTRIMGYRNSFAPSVVGQVRDTGVGSIITVTMRPHIFVIVFCVVWMLIAMSGLALGGGQIWMALLLVAMLYGMVMFGFWLEAGKQEQTLREIFKAI